MRPEVAPGPGKVLIFEQPDLALFLVEQEIQTRRDEPRDTSVNLPETFLGVAILNQERREEGFRTVDIVLCAVVDVDRRPQSG